MKFKMLYFCNFEKNASSHFVFRKQNTFSVGENGRSVLQKITLEHEKFVSHVSEHYEIDD